MGKTPVEKRRNVTNRDNKLSKLFRYEKEVTLETLNFSPCSFEWWYSGGGASGTFLNGAHIPLMCGRVQRARALVSRA